MAVTVSGTSITFNDATVQTTAATAPTTAQVLNATASASTGAVGSYAFLAPTFGSRTSVTSNGNTRAGSNLNYYGVSGGTVFSTTGSTVAGTWRNLGANSSNQDQYGNWLVCACVWLRIS